MATNCLRPFRFCTKLFLKKRFNGRKYSMYVPTHELVQRRHNLANEVYSYATNTLDHPSKHLIILPAAEVQYMAFHVPYPFHQDSNYFYCSGLNEPNSVLILFVSVDQSKCEHLSHLFIDIKTKHREIWDGPSIGLLEASLLSGIEESYPLTDLICFLQKNIQSSKITHLWYTPLTAHNFEQRPFNKGIFSDILKLFDEVTNRNICIKNPDILVDNLRFIKSPFEIEQLKTASQLTIRALKSTVGISFPNMSESTLHNHIDHQLRSLGASLSYPPVIAGGQRANIIHYLKSDKEIKDGDLVLMDVGCKVNGYTSDITRTWPISGRFTSPQSILYEILADVQKCCATMASPCVSLDDLYKRMLQEFRRHLINERIIPSNTGLEVIQKLCPHHIGHYLGLDVHDTPTISNHRPLCPGVVFPLEPGLYFRKDLASIGFPKEFLDLGMRLEDDFVILENGNAQILADEFPNSICEFEKIIGCMPLDSNNLRS